MPDKAIQAVYELLHQYCIPKPEYSGMMGHDLAEKLVAAVREADSAASKQPGPAA